MTLWIVGNRRNARKPGAFLEHQHPNRKSTLIPGCSWLFVISNPLSYMNLKTTGRVKRFIGLFTKLGWDMKFFYCIIFKIYGYNYATAIFYYVSKTMIETATIVLFKIKRVTSRCYWAVEIFSSLFGIVRLIQKNIKCDN